MMISQSSTYKAFKLVPKFKASLAQGRGAK